MKNPFARLALVLLVSATVTLDALADDAPAVGVAAPDFNLQDQNGDWHKLADYSGKWLAVYFYPKDDTPGCTTEACSFRDNIFAFEAIGAKVVGISVDDVDSHKEFSEKYKLPFTLLADPGGKVCKSYGVLSNYLGLKIASRESFIIDPDGRIARHYSKVDPNTHTEEVLADLQSLMGTD